MTNRPKSLQDLQRTGGINITNKDRVYLNGISNGGINNSHGDKMKYLMRRGYLTRSQEWTALGRAAMKVVQDDKKRAKNRQKQEKELD